MRRDQMLAVLRASGTLPERTSLEMQRARRPEDIPAWAWGALALYVALESVIKLVTGGRNGDA